MHIDFIDCMKSRRSIRKYSSDLVDKETIEQIIQAGKYAPSAKNTQPWRFIVITNKDMINTLSNEVKLVIRRLLKWRFIHRFRHHELREIETLQFLFSVSSMTQDSVFFQAPVVIFIVSEKKGFYDESCACCAQNMMLAAHALGIGSCWVGLGHFIGLNKGLMQTIGVPGKYHIAACLIFGHSEQTSGIPLMRKPCSDVIRWID
jgi:nitroreductase